MTQEEKQLLLKDICGRLPYKVKCLVNLGSKNDEIMTLYGYSYRGTYPNDDHRHLAFGWLIFEMTIILKK